MPSFGKILTLICWYKFQQTHAGFMVVVLEARIAVINVVVSFFSIQNLVKGDRCINTEVRQILQLKFEKDFRISRICMRGNKGFSLKSFIRTISHIKGFVLGKFLCLQLPSPHLRFIDAQSCFIDAQALLTRASTNTVILEPSSKWEKQ